METILLSTKLIIISIFFAIHIIGNIMVEVAGNSWCVARSDASNQALQTALDYACGAGADCSPILSNGLCFLPNTIQAHASYAFNSYYQRKSMAPGSCDFAGTANIARTDPSYGSCVYPSSLSAVGGTPSTTGTTPTTTNPNTQIPSSGGGTYGLNPETPPLPPNNSKASLQFMITPTLMPVCLLLVLSLLFSQG